MEEKPVEIKQVSEREIRVGENRLYLGEDNILYLAVLGEVDEEIEIGINEATYKLINMVEGKTNVFIDLNKAGKISTAARKRQEEISEHEKIGKVALFGLHPVARVLASFFVGASKRRICVFSRQRKRLWHGLRGETRIHKIEKYKRRLRPMNRIYTEGVNDG